MIGSFWGEGVPKKTSSLFAQLRYIPSQQFWLPITPQPQDLVACQPELSQLTNNPSQRGKQTVGINNPTNPENNCRRIVHRYRSRELDIESTSDISRFILLETYKILKME